MPESAGIKQNSDEGISDFRICDQSFVKGNCHNSRTSGDIGMELGRVTKPVKGKKTSSKKFADGVISENHDVIAIFSI